MGTRVSLGRRISIYIILIICAMSWGLLNGQLQKVLFWPWSNYMMHKTYDLSASDKVKVLAVWHLGLGEREQTKRLRVAMERVGVEFREISELPEHTWQRYVAQPVQRAIELMHPDIIITLQTQTSYYPGAQKNFKVLDMLAEQYLVRDSSGKLLLNRELREFDGFLVSFPELELLDELNQTMEKKYLFMQWYPTMYKTDFKPAIPRTLLYMGGNDPTRSSAKYETVFANLINSGIIEYPAYERRMLQNRALCSRAAIPFDGVSLLNEIHKSGMLLVLHYKGHLHGGVPTGRIFEGAAANVVMIADKNEFIVKNFADNVLYVDVDGDPEHMLTQIKEHVAWIKSHPRAAQAKAQRCHQILLEKFALEQQILALLQLG